MSDYDKTNFRYDLDAYGFCVKENDFKQANIFANRIMSNAFLFDKKDFGIIGHIFKEIANDGIVAQQGKDEKLLLEYSEKSQKVIGVVVKMLDSDSIDIKKIWSHYSAHQDSTNKLFNSEYEIKAYQKPDKAFSNKAIQKLMNLLEENITLLGYRSNDLYRGVLNETGRISKIYGLYDYDEHFTSLLRLMQKIDEYVKQTSNSNDFLPRSQKEIIPLTKEITSIYNSITPENKQEEKIDNLLWILIKIWRLFFVKFMERGQVSYSFKDEQIPDDPEKSKLVDEVTKYIEKELGV
jgi:hypothetical protein